MYVYVFYRLHLMNNKFVMNESAVCIGAVRLVESKPSQDRIRGSLLLHNTLLVNPSKIGTV